jgi:phage gpG-like protein
MNWNDLSDYFYRLSDEVMEEIPDIVAETATEYFKEAFTSKSFDGNPWEPAKVSKTTGSLLVESGNLVNSIRPAYVGKDKVIISAGNDKVEYAKTHNEGYTGPVTVPAHTRRTKKGPVNVQQHTRTANIPQRQFMSKAQDLAKIMYHRIVAHLDGRLKR